MTAKTRREEKNRPQRPPMHPSFLKRDCPFGLRASWKLASLLILKRRLEVIGKRREEEEEAGKIGCSHHEELTHNSDFFRYVSRPMQLHVAEALKKGMGSLESFSFTETSKALPSKQLEKPQNIKQRSNFLADDIPGFDSSQSKQSKLRLISRNTRQQRKKPRQRRSLNLPVVDSPVAHSRKQLLLEPVPSIWKAIWP